MDRHASFLGSRGADELSNAPKTAKFLTEGDLMKLMNRRDDCE